jgi:hypothetical protein
VRHELDPEVAAALNLVRTGAADPARVPARGDWRTLREIGNAGQAYMSAITPASQGVTRTGYWAQAPDGARIELRWYQRRDERPGSAVIYAHGGGMGLAQLAKIVREAGHFGAVHRDALRQARRRRAQLPPVIRAQEETFMTLAPDL